MTHSSEFFMYDLKTMASEPFIELCRNGNNRAFTRMPLSDLMLSILARRGKTLYLELPDFMKVKAAYANLKTSITVSGYLKQRLMVYIQDFSMAILY